eukprot:jgi/Mesvir1/19698/Mv09963-RA.1
MTDQADLLRQLLAINSRVDSNDELRSGCHENYSSLAEENKALRGRIARLEEILAEGRGFDGPHSLTTEEVVRYGRHLMVPSFGVEGQDNLKKSSVLVVGAGGLGSPALLYLAASGVGRLGICDYDKVELHNLQRQVIHSEASLGMPKAWSAANACRRINSSLALTVHNEPLTPQNALDMVSTYDVVVDGSDNVGTRYLLNDACVVAHKPLVSAGCIGTEGQLTVYHWGEDGPCYRCLFPTPPPADACQRCSDTGVLGVVPGIMGCLQALEVVKVASRKGKVMSRRLLLLDALSGRIQTVTLRPKVPDCIACGAHPSVVRESLPSFNYAGFTGAGLDDKPPCGIRLLPPEQRVSPAELALMVSRREVVNVGTSCGRQGTEPPSADREGSSSKDPPREPGGALHGGGGEEGRKAGAHGGVASGGGQPLGPATDTTRSTPQANPVQPTAHGSAGKTSLALQATGHGSTGRTDPVQAMPHGRAGEARCMILDVRPAHEFAIASLAQSWNVPFASFQTQRGVADVMARLCGKQGGEDAETTAAADGDINNNPQGTTTAGREASGAAGELGGAGSPPPPGPPSLLLAEGAEGAGAGEQPAAHVVVVCRRGNDSQIVADMLNRAGKGRVAAVDLAGGLQAWGREVDPRFPVY